MIILYFIPGRRPRMVDQNSMDALYGFSPKRKNSRLDVRSLKIFHGDMASGIQTAPSTKRSARIANSKKRNSNQAITNFFQKQAKLSVDHSHGLDTAEESDPTNHEDDDNACDSFGSSFGHHFAPSIRQSFGSMGDDSNSNSSVEPNIFLQKPVLHLNIDKSPNQASSIVINKHLEVSPNFSTTLVSFTNSKIAANRMDGVSFGSNVVTARSGANHKTKRRKPRIGGGCIIDALTSSDSNSCDSGVVADKRPEPNATMLGTAKPTTPHRILCTASTSPVKPMQKYTQKAMTFSNMNNGPRYGENTGETIPTARNEYKSKRR